MKTASELRSYLAEELASSMMDPPDSDHMDGYLEAKKEVYRTFFWGRDENFSLREPRDPSTLREYLTGVPSRLPAPSSDTEYQCGYRSCMEEIYRLFCMPEYTRAPLDYHLLGQTG
jgi:hypothetical protein